jgi:hypothetical protein
VTVSNFSWLPASESPKFENSNHHIYSFKKFISEFLENHKRAFYFLCINLRVLKIYKTCEDKNRMKFGVFSWRFHLQKAVFLGMVAHCRLICAASATTTFPEEHLWILGEEAILLGTVPEHASFHVV